jgi:hypothetical protein
VQLYSSPLSYLDVKYLLSLYYYVLLIWVCLLLLFLWVTFEDFEKCHNLLKRNAKLILKILSDLEPLREGLVEQKKRCIQLVRV